MLELVSFNLTFDTQYRVMLANLEAGKHWINRPYTRFLLGHQ
jgi:hypothetical protein